MPSYYKEIIKKIVTNINIHIRATLDNEKNKDLLILSSPRSGSTMLMEMIYANRNVKFINEPLDKNYLDFNGYLPIGIGGIT